MFDPYDMDANRSCSAGSLQGSGDFGTVPHELGHLFQRYHPNQTGPYDQNPYPYPRPYFLEEWGFGVEGGRMLMPDKQTNMDALHQFISPGDWYEMMANGPYPKWVTAHTYNEIFVVLSAINAWSRGGPDGEAAYQEYFESRALRGSVDMNGHWSWSVSFGGDAVAPSDDAANYAEFRGANVDDLPLQITLKPEYAYVDPPEGEGEEHVELRGVVVPLPADHDERELSGLYIVVEGEAHEVSMDFVLDNLPRDIDWQTKLEQHLAR